MKNTSKWKKWLLQSLKIAAAAVLAIAIAGELGLKYSATAGIITILSIQNTKRETLKTAGNRGLAFAAALLLAGLCFRMIGYNLLGYAVFLLLFALLCLGTGRTEALTMCAVLISHFLAEGNMNGAFLLQECLVFGIGAGMGILVNLHLHKRSAEFDRLAENVDEQIKGILKRMSQWLPREDKSAYGDGCFECLEKSLEEAKLCAAANFNNALKQSDASELDYIRMRERQSVILKEIYVNIKALEFLPEQAKQVAELFGRIEQGYHKENTVEGLLEDLEKLLADMKAQRLPGTREEFEARAILFYILMQIRNLLMLKWEYVQNV